MRMIKLFPAPHVEMRIHVSDKMIGDLKECKGKEGGDLPCEECSWDMISVLGLALCGLREVKEKILAMEVPEEERTNPEEEKERVCDDQGGRMKRLTEKDDQGNWGLKGLRWQQLYVGQTITKEVQEKLYGALCKLKGYEETGLSPEEAERLNAFEGSQIEHLLLELEKERERHRWIPVEERLPEDSDKIVLIQVSGRPCENIELKNAIEFASYNKEEGWILENYPDWEGAKLVAWQPLPELYEK